MAKKKFRTPEAYHRTLHEIEWQSKIVVNTWIEEISNRLNSVPYETDHLKDAHFLLKLLQEKIAAHNGQCNQIAGRMKTCNYKRDNIETA